MKDLLTEIGNVLSEEMTISNVVVSAMKELMPAVVRDSKKKPIGMCGTGIVKRRVVLTYM